MFFGLVQSQKVVILKRDRTSPKKGIKILLVEMGLSYVTQKSFVMLAHATDLVAMSTDKQLSPYVIVCEHVQYRDIMSKNSEIDICISTNKPDITVNHWIEYLMEPQLSESINKHLTS